MTPREGFRGSGENPLSVSAPTETMDADTDTSRPGWSCNSEPGLADQKDTDRLMDIVTRTSDNRPAQPSRPSICPICALFADNGVMTRAEHTATATYLDTEGHMWSVTWLEVA